MARVKVKLFANFREVSGVRELELTATTVKEVLDLLTNRYPNLQELFYEEGELRDYVNIMVNGKNIRRDVSWKLKDGDIVAIFPPVSGG